MKSISKIRDHAVPWFTQFPILLALWTKKKKNYLSKYLCLCCCVPSIFQTLVYTRIWKLSDLNKWIKCPSLCNVYRWPPFIDFYRSSAAAFLHAAIGLSRRLWAYIYIYTSYPCLGLFWHKWCTPVSVCMCSNSASTPTVRIQRLVAQAGRRRWIRDEMNLTAHQSRHTKP